MRFEEILDELIDKLEKGENWERYREKYPEFFQEFEPLLPLVLAIKNLPKPEPSPERITTILLTIKRQIKKKEKKMRFPLIVPLRAVAIPLLLLLFGWLTLFFTNRSMPGEVLYPLKRRMEKWQISLVANRKKDILLHLKFADRRANEGSWFLRERNQISAPLLQGMLAEITSALSLFDQNSSSFTEEEKECLIGEIKNANEKQRGILAEMRSCACGCETTFLDAAIRKCEKIGEWVEERMGKKSPPKEKPCPCR